jgi:hypothetical protein
MAEIATALALSGSGVVKFGQTPDGKKLPEAELKSPSVKIQRQRTMGTYEWKCILNGSGGDFGERLNAHVHSILDGSRKGKFYRVCK